MWVTIVGCFLFTFYMVKYLYRWTIQLQRHIINKIIHINLYWKVFQKLNFSTNGYTDEIIDKDEIKNFKKEQSDLILSQGSLSILKLSSVMSFTDYFLKETTRTQKHSLTRFFNVLFEETIQDEVIDVEIKNLKKDKVSLKKLKSIYHQFCLMNNFKEANIEGQLAKQMLKEKGFVVTSSETYSTFYLIRIAFKSKNDVNFVTSDHENESSLKVFIDNFCTITEFDEDKIGFDFFMSEYDLFCRMHHYEKVLIDYIVLQRKFGIESKRIIKPMVERDDDYSANVKDRNKSNSCITCISKCFKLFKNKKFYKFKLKKIENVNLFMSGNLTTKDTPIRELYKIVREAVLPKKWYVFDIASVFLLIFIKLLLSIPFLSIFIFQEIEHSVYSIRDESINVYGFNIRSNDIWLLPGKIWRNTVLLVVTILFLLFWLSSIFFMIHDSIYMDYPWIKTFRPNNVIKFKNIVNAYQWAFIFTALLTINTYISIVVVWDILASLMKPDAYIVSSAMAISLVYLVFTLRKEFNKIANYSFLKFNKTFKYIWEDRVRLITKKMKKGYAYDEIQNPSNAENDFRQTKFVRSLEETKASMKRLIVDYPQSQHLINFIFAYLEKDRI